MTTSEAPPQAGRMLVPSRKRAWLLGGPFLLLALFGLLLALSGEWAGWPMAALFGLGGVALFAITIPTVSHLKLDRDGLTVRSFFQDKRYRWADIHSFFETTVDRRGAVGFDFADRDAVPAAKQALHKLRGYDVYLPDSYGMTVPDLAALLEDWRKANS